MRRDEWQLALSVANNAFGIAPEVFWRMSVCEWHALIAQRTPSGALTRTELDAMLAGTSGGAA